MLIMEKECIALSEKVDYTGLYRREKERPFIGNPEWAG